MQKMGTSKNLAVISLVVMAAGFLLTIPLQDHWWGKLLQGGFEAGLVGGLADWFAVTALFRHPLGIPIPHTALLPNNREKVTRALIRMLEEDWLTISSIMDKMKQIHFTEKILAVLRKEIQSPHFQKALTFFMLGLIKKIDLDKLGAFLEKELKTYLRESDASVLVTSVAQGIHARGYDEAALDYILNETGKWAATQDAKQTMGKLGKQLIETTEADGLMKFAIQSFSSLVNEDKMGQMMQTFILNRIRNVSKSDNRYRKIILDWVRKELTGLENRQELLGEINEWKNKLVDELEMDRPIKSILAETKLRMMELAGDEKFAESSIVPILLKLIEDIGADEEKISAIESWIHKQAAALVEKNHSKLGLLVKENLEKLDTETLIAMIENNVGKDLQWIRVNGALCGFMIGLVLTGFKLFI